jgi:hypothetical protein
MRRVYRAGARLLYTAGLVYTLYIVMRSLFTTYEFASWQILGARTKVVLYYPFLNLLLSVLLLFLLVPLFIYNFLSSLSPIYVTR